MISDGDALAGRRVDTPVARCGLAGGASRHARQTHDGADRRRRISSTFRPPRSVQAASTIYGSPGAPSVPSAGPSVRYVSWGRALPPDRPPERPPPWRCKAGPTIPPCGLPCSTREPSCERASDMSTRRDTGGHSCSCCSVIKKGFHMRKTIGLLPALFSIAALVTGTAIPAAAEVYPERPITVIVPFAPGGSTDIMARTIGSGRRTSPEATARHQERVRRQRFDRRQGSVQLETGRLHHPDHGGEPGVVPRHGHGAIQLRRLRTDHPDGARGAGSGHQTGRPLENHQ